MIEVFQVTEERPGGAAYVAPISKDNNGKYLIEFDSKAEAEATLAELSSGNLPTPLVDSSRYELPRMHVNGVTRVFRVKKAKQTQQKQLHHRDNAGESISDEDRETFMDDVYGKGRR